ncbi:MAG: Cytidine deaminase Cdd [Thermoanaerobacterales bacterium 50_218]|nr:MAG: Cytidine deaminase Cdd [Thermoanaerobacterales bacterium 50_218]HAA89200.1 cytidine deaminase [Peptococcaceae bacterium]
MQDEKLLQLARQAAAKAYAPYSRFPVGAALLGADGEVFTGCNVENASYGLTVCAERVAVAKAVSCGVREFHKLAVWAPVAVWPCGACLQVLAEFVDDLQIIRWGSSGEVEVKHLQELLSLPFKSSKRK